MEWKIFVIKKVCIVIINYIISLSKNSLHFLKYENIFFQYQIVSIEKG